MSEKNLLLTLRQINICLNIYENEKLAASEMTFAQAFLLNEIFSMDSSCVNSTELCERIGFTRSSISRTLKELRKNGYLGEQGRRAMAALAAAGAAGKNAAKNTASFGPAEMSRIARNVAKFVSMSGVGSAKWAEEVEKALDNGSLTEAEANELLKMYGYDT